MLHHGPRRQIAAACRRLREVSDSSVARDWHGSERDHEFAGRVRLVRSIHGGPPAIQHGQEILLYWSDSTTAQARRSEQMYIR